WWCRSTSRAPTSSSCGRGCRSGPGRRSLEVPAEEIAPPPGAEYPGVTPRRPPAWSLPSGKGRPMLFPFWPRRRPRPGWAASRRRPPWADSPLLDPLEERLAPAVFTVSVTADGGPGSLRQAVQDANATPGADTITFALAPGAVIALTGQLTVTDGVTLAGPGVNQLAIYGQAAVRRVNLT